MFPLLSSRLLSQQPDWDIQTLMSVQELDVCQQICVVRTSEKTTFNPEDSQHVSED